MSCTVPILRFLLCAAFFTSADAAGISSLLPHHILMNTSLIVDNPPVRTDLLSVRWEHAGRTLVEYKDGNLTFYSPFVMMSLEQIRQGNISLVLTNLTLKDAGNYTCVVQYIGVEQTAVYRLIIERNRIRLLKVKVTPPPQKAGVSSVKSSKKRSLLHVEGDKFVTAQLGDNITLQCRYKMAHAIELSMLNVHWSKDGVTKYFSNKTCCEFPGHEISEEDLQNGIAPLELIDVQEKDAGNYACTIKYEKMEGSWTTIFRIGPLNPETSTSSKQTVTTAVTTGTNKPVVPEATLQYRTLKFGLVSGALAITGLVAAAVYICFDG